MPPPPPVEWSKALWRVGSVPGHGGPTHEGPKQTRWSTHGVYSDDDTQLPTTRHGPDLTVNGSLSAGQSGAGGGDGAPGGGGGEGLGGGGRMRQ